MTEQNIHLLWDSEVENLITDHVLNYVEKIENVGAQYPDASLLEITAAVKQHLLDNGLDSNAPIVVTIDEPLPAFLSDEESDETSFDEPIEPLELVEEGDTDVENYEKAIIDSDWDEALEDDAEWELHRAERVSEERSQFEADWDEAIADDLVWETNASILAEAAHQVQLETEKAQKIAEDEQAEFEADWDEALEDDLVWESNHAEEVARKEAYDKYEDAINAKASVPLSNTRKAILSHLHALHDED